MTAINGVPIVLAHTDVTAHDYCSTFRHATEGRYRTVYLSGTAPHTLYVDTSHALLALPNSLISDLQHEPRLAFDSHGPSCRGVEDGAMHGRQGYYKETYPEILAVRWKR